MPAKFKRGGLHRLECPACPGYAYGTVANLETVGLPTCACGARLQPTELDLAFILGAEDARPMVDYRRECNSVAKGQASHGRAGRVLKRSPEEVAMERVESARRVSARQRRISALLPSPEPMPF